MFLRKISPFGEVPPPATSLSVPLPLNLGGEGSGKDCTRMVYNIFFIDVLKKFNSNIHGQSFGIDDDFPNSQFNVAFPGARAEDLVPQAYNLIKLMKNHSDMVKVFLFCN